MRKSQKSKVKSQKFRKGFSLVELMVVLAIMTIMTGVLLANQNNNKAQENVEAAARQLAAQLRQLQNDALGGKQISGVAACSFRFDIANGTSTYKTSYYSSCSASGSALSSLTSNLNSKGLLNGTAKANNAASFYFIAPRAELAGAAFPLLIDLVSATKHASVCVCGSGNILEAKDASACAGC